MAEEEIEQCFANRSGVYLIDDREEHQSNPPTRWFIAETDFGRKLKVVFMPMGKDIHLRSAYDPEPEAVEIYSEHHGWK